MPFSLNRKYSHHGRSTNDVIGRLDEDVPRNETSPIQTTIKCKLSKFCHECGQRFPETAKFCCECGVRRLALWNASSFFEYCHHCMDLDIKKWSKDITVKIFFREKNILLNCLFRRHFFGARIFQKYFLKRNYILIIFVISKESFSEIEKFFRKYSLIVR